MVHFEKKQERLVWDSLAILDDFTTSEPAHTALVLHILSILIDSALEDFGETNRLIKSYDANYQNEIATKVDNWGPTWKGRSVELVVAVFGEPSRRVSDREGGEVLTFTETSGGGAVIPVHPFGFEQEFQGRRLSKVVSRWGRWG